ncbi:hypothetical protein HELRODRAFT_83547, partial [Helobdella robusta]|uniref:Mitochondrial GTPase 1 n=1 Tax=Helobdella robusta TaxID=6412 RepID=T1G570_HELRO
IPLSGRNQKFSETLMVRPHILLLNKVDLINKEDIPLFERVLKLENPNLQAVLHSCCKNDLDSTIKTELLPCITNIMKTSNRYHRNETQDYNVLVIGIPNVGKSSLINSLRNVHLKKGIAASVGAKPGITRTVMEKIKVSNSPKIYIYDTPGIMSPSVTDMDVAMKLALCATIPDKQFDIVNMADYLLFTLNLQEMFGYVSLYDINEPADDIYILLTLLCKKFNLVMKINDQGEYVYRPNYERASQIFIKDFRDCKLGKVNLDMNLLRDKQHRLSDSLHNS